MNNPVNSFSSAIQKPDLLLCEEGVILKQIVQKEKFDVKTDIYSLGEVKQKYSDDHKKDLYVKLAGKVAFLLEVQDGHCAVPGIQLLGLSIVLTLFNQGGSISTYPLNIHLFPEQFLHILLGITFTDRTMLGFDSTITPIQNSQKTIWIVKQCKYQVLQLRTDKHDNFTRALDNFFRAKLTLGDDSGCGKETENSGLVFFPRVFGVAKILADLITTNR